MLNPIKNTVISKLAILSLDQLMDEWAAIFVFGMYPQVTLKYQSVCLRKKKKMLFYSVYLWFIIYMLHLFIF